MDMASLFTELVRWVFVVLAVFILVRAIVSLLRSKNPAEVWAYMQLRTYRTDEEGNPLDWQETSVPLTHWENVIGRSKSCDISVEDAALSRNHGILMRTRTAAGPTGIWAPKTVHTSTESRLWADAD